MVMIQGYNNGTTDLTATCTTISAPAPTCMVSVGSIMIGPVLRNPELYGQHLPPSVSPTLTTTAWVQFEDTLDGMTVAFSVGGTGNANNGSASVSPATLTTSGTVAVTGITQTSTGYSGNLFIEATGGGGNVLGTSPGFSVSRPPPFSPIWTRQLGGE